MCGVALNKERIIMRALSLTAAVLAAGLAFTFTGCGSKDSGGNSSSGAVPAAMETTDVSSMTDTEFLSCITLCGTPIPYPLTLDGLGEDFSFDTASVRDYGDAITVRLLKGEEYVCLLQFGCGTEDLSGTSPAEMLLFMPEEENRNKLSVNGITANDKLASLEKALGTPVEKDDSSLTYKTSAGVKMSALSGSDDRISTFVIYLN